MIIYYTNLYTILNIEFNKLILNLLSKQLKTNKNLLNLKIC